MSEAILTVNGHRYGGWKNVVISLGMEAIANSFEFTASERFPDHPEAWKVELGDACSVAIGKETVITGYVDDTYPEESHDDHTIRIMGRDKTGDLVDCSVLFKEWHNVTFTRIATDICKPFGITVIARVDVGPKFSRFSVWPGETAFECLERAARMRGLLLISDGFGNLVITRAGASVVTTPLIRGENIESSSGAFSWRDRYSHYTVMGQSPGDTGGNTGRQRRNLQTKSTVIDKGIAAKRYRPLVIIAEPGDHSTYQDRATWERNIRHGRGSRVTFTVTGWEHSTGVWRPNTIVPVQNAAQGINGFLIICNVRLILDDLGTRAELTTTLPESFELINLPDSHGRKKRTESARWT